MIVLRYFRISVWSAKSLTWSSYVWDESYSSGDYPVSSILSKKRKQVSDRVDVWIHQKSILRADS